MGFVLPKPKTLKGGSRIARQVIPADVRDEYQRLYGKTWEERWRADTGISIAEQKKSYAEWYAEVWRRFEAIRAGKRGDAIELTRTDAAALAGEWYSWFIARYENDPGRPERWDHEFWHFVEAMQHFAPDEVRAEPMRDLGWSRDPEIRAGIRPVVADVGNTAQFLASRGVTLTSQAQAVFLDFVVDNYIEALLLLERRASNDYSTKRQKRSRSSHSRNNAALTGNRLGSYTKHGLLPESLPRPLSAAGHLCSMISRRPSPVRTLNR
jgi:hypothetical protein